MKVTIINLKRLKVKRTLHSSQMVGFSIFILHYFASTVYMNKMNKNKDSTLLSFPRCEIGNFHCSE